MIVFKQVAKQILKNLHERVIMNHPSTSYNVNHNITNKKCVCVCALFMQHCGDPQGKTWKRDIFNIVGSPRPQKKKKKKL